MKKLTIGLFGFGVVGEGIYKVLNEKKQLDAEIKKVVVKHSDKERNAPKSLFSTQTEDILNDDEINLVVELIDDADAAYHIVKQAIVSGKSVVTANKKMVAEHLEELVALSKEKGVSFLYEAAVCGSIPIIRNLEEYFDNDLLTHVSGVVNGSTNYILSKMYSENQSYEVALKDAQEKGFAESDPALDVEGVDAAYKLSIISLHAFGSRVVSEDVIRKGITSIDPFDFQYAREKNCVIKLVASCSLGADQKSGVLTVLPTFVSQSDSLGLIHNEYNGVLVGSTLADEQFFHGKGAGRYPTSSAVLSDISALQYDYAYAYKKGVKQFRQCQDERLTVYVAFDHTAEVNLSELEDITERYIGKTRSYVIGHIRSGNLKDSILLKNPEVSVVQIRE
jgi:homoserine dehydrogenase